MTSNLAHRNKKPIKYKKTKNHKSKNKNWKKLNKSNFYFGVE